MRYCCYLTLIPSFGALQLPASLFAYRKQQHRWSAGPTQLIKLAMREVRVPIAAVDAD